MMDASYERKRFAHHDNTDMDHSYSHLKLKESEILTDMASAVETPYPKKPLDKAVVAHCGVERLKTGSMWADHCAFRGINISPVVQVGDEQKHRFYAKYKTGTKEPLHIHAKASTEWVVLSGKFDIETGPVYPIPGAERVRATLVAGSFLAIPKGQPHKIHCLESGVVFVSYEGKPDISTVTESA
mmetsp:Transcript_8041/g.25184  ORF Transcript_8041/g.25184 Transcript_8041/m.25184 type:complete len:185 (-) Transcript_8041:48-602(-)